MNRSSMLLAAGGLIVPSAVWAQSPPGWQVCWGNACNVSVPLDPWMAAATGILLLLVALAALRRNTRGAAYLLAGALVVSGYVVYEIRSANAFSADIAITTPSGIQTQSCGIPSSPAGGAAAAVFPSLSVGNISGGPVVLGLTPVNGASTGWLNPPTTCQQGGTLNNGSSCLLPCGPLGPPV